MAGPRVVLDTNVIYAGLRSRRGASFRLLALMGTGQFEPAVSVPLVLEYEAAASRLVGTSSITHDDIDTLLNYLCSISHHQDIFFAWRPTLRDPSDDFILELAVAASCQFVVTFNLKDFRGIESFGIQAVTPPDFLSILKGTP